MEISKKFDEAFRYATAEDGNKLTRFEEALLFAARLHGSHLRKGTKIPYSSHLMAVTSLVMEHGGDEDTQIAALLHDAVEDRGGEETRQVIEKHFGATVAGIVKECSDAEVKPKPPWEQRKRTYLARLQTASPEARLVSAADKVHNARALLADYREIGKALWERFNPEAQSAERQLWYHRALVDEFKRGGPAALAAELERVVGALEDLVREKERGALAEPAVAESPADVF